jgi:hypothetical protein
MLVAMPIVVESEPDPKGVPLRGYRIDRRGLHALREEWVRHLPDCAVTTTDELNTDLESHDRIRVSATDLRNGARRFALLDIDTAEGTATLVLENVDSLPLPTSHMESLNRWRQLLQPHAFLVDGRTAERRRKDRRNAVGWVLGSVLVPVFVTWLTVTLGA